MSSAIRSSANEAHSVSSQDPGRVRIDGDLIIKDTRIPLPLDVTVHAHGDAAVELACHAETDPVALGIRGARGMVPRAVQRALALTLRQAIA